MSDDKLTRIEDKIDLLAERLNSVDKTLVKQHEQLAYHIRRTDLLEAEVKPISEHVSFIRVTVRIVGILALVAGVIRLFM